MQATCNLNPKYVSVGLSCPSENLPTVSTHATEHKLEPAMERTNVTVVCAPSQACARDQTTPLHLQIRLKTNRDLSS